MNQKSSKKNYVLIIIHPDGKVTKVIQPNEPTLEQLQKAVGGYIELIPYFTQLAIQGNGKIFAYNQGIGYANEEGKLPHLNLPVNTRATEVWKNQCAYVDQWLVGDILFVARTAEPCVSFQQDSLPPATC